MKRYVHPRSGKRSCSLRDLYGECTPEERLLSAAWYRHSSEGQGTGHLTPFTGIHGEPAALAGPPSADTGLGLRESLLCALPCPPQIDVAVSGGIDCWLLAAILQSQGCRVRGWYLETGVPGYCERPAVERFSEILGVPCRYLRAGAADFVETVPALISITETPIYNLHPISKLLLARMLRDEGITALVSGDGADQVMRHEWDCDLLPLTLACFRSAGVHLIAPFLSAPVLACCREPDPHKRAIRDLAREMGLPEVPKHPTMFPAVALPPHPRAALPLAGADADRLACLSYTTGLLLERMEDHQPCAASRA